MSDGGDLVGLLPHRPPMRLLDSARRVEERAVESSQRIPEADPMLSGHFPGFPIWPGALLLEAMAQTTAIYLLEERQGLDDAEIPVLGAVDCRFLGPVFPGETISYRVELVRRVGDNALFNCHARRDGEVVARGRISAGINRRANLRSPEACATRE